MKPPFWMKLDGPYEDATTGEVYLVARVRWYGWPVFFLIVLKEWVWSRSQSR
jgi:hypothetical protein